MVDRYDIVKASIENDKRELKFTDSLMAFLRELNEIAPQKESRPTFRVSLEDSCFFLGFEDEEGITPDDKVVHEEESRFKLNSIRIVCNEVDFDVLRGTTVDYELYGLSKQVVFKDERFKRPYCCGELHPMAAHLMQR
jgi:Fe-S cluster assembly iron-binding protein IscA